VADQLYKREKERREKRKTAFLKERSEIWLFVCEGTKTEPNYLQSLIGYANQLSEESPIKAEIKGVGKNTESLINSVNNFFDCTDEFNAKKQGIPYSKVFVLFDKDSFEPKQFDNAIIMAENRGYIPIWSNECFELWYILHYDYYSSDNGRQSYFDRLSKLLKVKYDKAEDIFSIITTDKRLKQAIQYSRKLDCEFTCEKSPSKKVPCTQMFKLIEEIEKRLRIKLG